MKKFFIMAFMLASSLFYSQESVTVKQVGNIMGSKQTMTLTDSIISVDYKNENYIDHDIHVISISESTVGNVKTKIYICQGLLNPDEQVRYTFLWKNDKFLILTEEKVDTFTGQVSKVYYK